MKFLRIILLIIISISPAYANTIYNLIKIPNLDIYETNTDNGLKYLKAYMPFEVGIRNDNVNCFNSNYFPFYSAAHRYEFCLLL